MPAVPNGTNTCSWAFSTIDGKWHPTDHCDAGFQCGAGPNSKGSLSHGEMLAVVEKYNATHGSSHEVPDVTGALSGTAKTVVLACEPIPVG
jgi:hypothetical protein